MKYLFFVSSFVFLSCVGTPKAFRKQTYPIPNGKKILLIHSVSPCFYDSYSEEKEVSFQIQEELEELGYSVVVADKIWEEASSPHSNDRLEYFQNQLKHLPNKNSSRILIWKEHADQVEATEVFVLRFVYPLKPNLNSIRVIWIDFSKKEINRFDWNWDKKNPFPFLDSIQKL
ncbi:hypothetical protein [Leptospira mtsangambouensis]|uniref:hypothetical protein n=1 Tax=Leptospira mtsangambouensis TaxID=2484912 RepID=UPI001EECC9DA|nr:hypothetical protein [Leptospira mtsangambouensis]MCG6139708.1 hypothetical protein [Leptospira mtsangambouensis]